MLNEYKSNLKVAAHAFIVWRHAFWSKTIFDIILLVKTVLRQEVGSTMEQHPLKNVNICLNTTFLLA